MVVGVTDPTGLARGRHQEEAALRPVVDEASPVADTSLDDLVEGVETVIGQQAAIAVLPGAHVSVGDGRHVAWLRRAHDHGLIGGIPQFTVRATSVINCHSAFTWRSSVWVWPMLTLIT